MKAIVGLRMSELMHMVSNYFQDIFTNTDDDDSKAIFQKVHNCISHDMNEELLRLFVQEEFGIRLRVWSLLRLLTTS